jgi:xanthine dehydrogenase YagS FAD-binding subunit
VKPFEFVSAGSQMDQVLKKMDTSAAAHAQEFIAGGTTLIDLMKLEVLTPGEVLDLNDLPLRGILLEQGALRIGALERMSDVAIHPAVASTYPVISEALLKSASAQIRNMATIGGNLLQRTRCGYFRDVNMPCNKRLPGSGCSAIHGENRMLAILGTSDSCVATHASDLAVALVALDASLTLEHRGGRREVKLNDFYLLPGQTPHLENQLQPGEIITEVRVPPLPWARRSTYLKIRDRESYEFALTSAAVALDLDGTTIRQARVAVGGVGTKPWLLPAVQDALAGKPATEETFQSVTKLATQGARTLSMNDFKVELLQRTLMRALLQVGGTV